MTVFLTLQEVVALHRKMMMSLGSPAAPLRNESGLESAVMRPRMAEVYEDAFHQEFGAPLDPVTANELRWFWEARALGTGVAEDKRMRRARRIFGTPRFRALRRVLEVDGHRAVDVAASTSLAEAIERAEGRIERHDIRRQYFRLSRAVGTA